MNIGVSEGSHNLLAISAMNNWWMSEYPSYASSQIPVSTQNVPYGMRPFAGMWSVTPPSQMPWNALPISRFTGTNEVTNQISTNPEPYVSFGKPQKRRVDASSSGPVQKQLITEEKVTETLRGLSLEDQNEDWLLPPKVDMGPKLVLSEEVKKFHENEEEIIPVSILKSYERPCNAVMLWKPPGGDIRNFIAEARLENDTDEDASLDVDNNNSVMPDMNLLQNWDGLAPSANPTNEEEMAD